MSREIHVHVNGGLTERWRDIAISLLTDESERGTWSSCCWSNIVEREGIRVYQRNVKLQHAVEMTANKNA